MTSGLVPLASVGAFFSPITNLGASYFGFDLVSIGFLDEVVVAGGGVVAGEGVVVFFSSLTSTDREGGLSFGGLSVTM